MLESLGRLWLAGVKADWRGFYEGERRRRVPLQPYPFERQRFWLEPRARSAGRPEADGDGAAVKKLSLSEWFYLPSWKPSLPPPPVEELRDNWLVLLDEGEFGRALAARLTALGRQVATAEMGGGFSRRGETAYTVRPGSVEDYRSLLEDLRARGRVPRAVVHAFSLTPAGTAGRGVAEFEKVQEYGFYSLLSLLQALAPHADEEVAVTVVSDSAVAAGGEALTPEKSTMLGLCRVAAQELPNITTRFVDVKLPDASAPAGVDAVLDSLMPELSAGLEDEVVAYRGRRRYVQGFEQVHPEAGPGVPPLREQGVYLITGGLTGNGFAVARYLARAVKARLVLVEREAVPGAAGVFDPGNGHQRQTPSDGDGAEPKLQRLAELIEAGAEVFMVAADAADEAQLTRAWLEGEARFGAIHGVVHAEEPSGERAFRAVLEAGREDCALHFRPKAHALYSLENVMRDREADFCVVLSSVAAVLGGVGYGPYAAANLFMDSFVRSSNQTNTTPWMSLNCDLWLGEDGHEQLTDLRGDLSELGMTAREGEEVFRQALSARGLDQLVVSTVDLPARLLATRTRFEGLRARQKQGDGAGAARHERPPLPTPYVAPETEMEHRIAAVWQQVLGFEPVGVEDNFFDLGGDSLVAIQVASRLKQALDIDFPVAKLYQGVTVRSLARLLSEGEDEERRRHAAEQAERQQAVGRRAQYIERRRSLAREVEG
ncbi:MAG TPA: KR domain-containing protein [Pyrinomonadaceae bacterium]